MKTVLKAKQLELERQIIEPRNTYGGMVTFWFDDGASEDYTAIYPLFEAQGEVGALSLITDTVDAEAGVTYAQALTMQNSGWEITNHTKDHTNLTTLTEAQIVDELEDSQTAFNSNGIYPTVLAYPNNASNFLVRKLARKYFKAARGTDGGTINKYALNMYNLASVDMDDWDLIDTYKAFVLQAYREKKWLIFYGHSGSYTAGDLTALDSLIDYAQSIGIGIVTPSTALASFENYVEYGDALAVNEKRIRMNAQTISPDFNTTGGAATVNTNVAITLNNIDMGAGGTARIDLTQSIDIDMDGSTLMFEYKPVNSALDPHIFSDSATGHYIRYRGSLTGLYVYQDATHYATISGIGGYFGDGVTTHIALTFTGNKVTAYINGVSQGENATTFTTDLSMDRITNTAASGIQLDNIRHFDRVLTESEIWEEMYSDYAVNNDNLLRQFKGIHFIGEAASPTFFANVKQYDLLLR